MRPSASIENGTTNQAKTTRAPALGARRYRRAKDGFLDTNDPGVWRVDKHVDSITKAANQLPDDHLLKDDLSQKDLAKRYLRSFVWLLDVIKNEIDDEMRRNEFWTTTDYRRKLSAARKAVKALSEFPSSSFIPPDENYDDDDAERRQKEFYWQQKVLYEKVYDMACELDAMVAAAEGVQKVKAGPHDPRHLPLLAVTLAFKVIFACIDMRKFLDVAADAWEDVGMGRSEGNGETTREWLRNELKRLKRKQNIASRS